MMQVSPHSFTRNQFEEVFKTHFGYLSNFAKQYVGDADTAQEITQKAFITLWEKRADINPKLSIKSYLFTIVKNRSLNYLRDTKRYRSEVLDIDCGDIEVSMEEHHGVEEELSALIENALATLPEKCRKVFEMSRFRQMKYKEIAEELDISQKTVKAHMSKAMKLLRIELKDYLFTLLLMLNLL